MMRGDRPGSRNSADQNQRENQPLHHGHTLHFILTIESVHFFIQLKSYYTPATEYFRAVAKAAGFGPPSHRCSRQSWPDNVRRSGLTLIGASTGSRPPGHSLPDVSNLPSFYAKYHCFCVLTGPVPALFWAPGGWRADCQL
jgi:hypothetical protein